MVAFLLYGWNCVVTLWFRKPDIIVICPMTGNVCWWSYRLEYAPGEGVSPSMLPLPNFVCPETERLMAKATQRRQWVYTERCGENHLRKSRNPQPGSAEPREVPGQSGCQTRCFQWSWTRPCPPSLWGQKFASVSEVIPGQQVHTGFGGVSPQPLI